MTATVTGSKVRTRWPDLAIALGLGVVAFVYRRRFPSDGLFFDDAWQALAAARGSFSQLFTVGQTQPGFGLGLMVWSRLVGDSAVDMITPALVAGTLGPPVLYLVLRRFHFARSIAALLGSALVVSATHIIYSGRVKVYMFEVLFVLALAVVVPWLVRRQWSAGIAIGWLVGGTLLASFSSFTLLAVVGAAIILVVHPRNDLPVRMASIGAQAVCVLALLVAIDRTHSAELLNDYFTTYDGYISFGLNPVTFGQEVFHHVTRITDVFPGGPPWFGVLCVVAAGAGLVAAAVRRDARAIAARFMIALVVMAFVGSLVDRVPFGPSSEAFRATLWLVPIVAFGLALALDRVRRGLAARGNQIKVGFDVAVFACAALLLFTPIGVTRPYPPGWLSATRQALATSGPDDVILLARTMMYSAAFNDDLPVEIQPRPETVQGFDPVFRDKRIHTVGFADPAEQNQIGRVVASTDRVVVLEPLRDPARYEPYRPGLATALEHSGFTRESVALDQRASIATYRRK